MDTQATQNPFFYSFIKCFTIHARKNDYSRDIVFAKSLQLSDYYLLEPNQNDHSLQMIAITINSHSDIESIRKIILQCFGYNQFEKEILNIFESCIRNEINLVDRFIQDCDQNVLTRIMHNSIQVSSNFIMYHQ